MYRFTEEEKQNFIKICNESESMTQASVKLNMHFNAFKKYALEFGCYHTNQSGKGMKKKPTSIISTQDILNGLYPDYQTYKLKARLIREGYIKDECAICGWNKKRKPDDEFTPCELHHKDGDRSNHSLDNLILLCPNCHSLTDNYRSLNSDREHTEEKSL